MVRNNGPAKAAPRWPDPRDGQETPRREPIYRQAAEPTYPGEPTFDPNAGRAGHAGIDGQGGEYAHGPSRDPHAHQHGLPQQHYSQQNYPTQPGYAPHQPPHQPHQPVYPQDGYAENGYGQESYPQDGYPQQGHAQQDGYPQQGYAQQDGYPQQVGPGHAEPHGGDPYAPASYGADPYAPDPYAGQRYAPNDAYGGQGHAGTGYPGQHQGQGLHDHGLQDPYAQPAADAYAPQFEPYQPPMPADPAEWGQGGVGSQRFEPGPAHNGQGGYAASRDARIAGDLYRPPNLPPRQHPPVAEPQLRGSTFDQHAQPAGWAPQHVDSGAAETATHGWGTARGYGDRDYEQGRGYADGAAHQDYAPAPYAPPAEPGFGPADPDYASSRGMPGEPSAQEAEYEPDEVAYEDDVPHNRGAMLKKMAAALVLAIGVGGSLAYGYKSFIGSGGSDKPPVVRTAGNPAKVKPDDPGGNKFAHSDSKILGRLGDGGASKPAAPVTATAAPEADASASDDPNGTRKVSTIVIGRDGTIMNTGSTAAAPPSAPPQGISPVPGMTIVDGFGGQRPRVSAQPPPSAATMARVMPVAPSPPPATAAETVVKPEVIARTEPAPPPAVKAPAVKAPAAKPEPPPIAAASEASLTEEAKPAPRQRTARAPGTVATAPKASSGAGYVAVLVSIPRSGSSRMDALKQFADLQQKYAAQLGGKTPDVQSADLGAKGSYDRLIIGPPGSRQQASKLCADLKTAGHGSCWVKSY